MASNPQSVLIANAPPTKSASEPNVKSRARARSIVLAGISHPDVRGFIASIRRSTMRLNPIAAVLAVTMQSNNRSTVSRVRSTTPAETATMTATAANGRAKMLCANLIIRPNERISERSPGREARSVVSTMVQGSEAAVRGKQRSVCREKRSTLPTLDRHYRPARWAFRQRCEQYVSKTALPARCRHRAVRSLRIRPPLWSDAQAVRRSSARG